MIPLETELKTENFDYVIDVHNNIRTLLIKLGLGVKGKRYNKLRLQRQLLASFNLSLPRSSHVVDRYMKTLENLGVNYDGNGLDFFIDHRFSCHLRTPNISRSGSPCEINFFIV